LKGTSKAALKAERDAFKANAAADGVKLTERYAYDSLWNGVSVSIAPSQVATLRSVPGVKAVYPVETLSLPDLVSENGGGSDIDLKNAVGLTGADIAQNELGLDGSGVTIAIMDSGLDYTLPEFGGCFGPGCKVRGGFDLVGNAYNATPGPAFDPVPQPDADPLPCDPNVADRAEVLGAGTSDARPRHARRGHRRGRRPGSHGRRSGRGCCSRRSAARLQSLRLQRRHRQRRDGACDGARARRSCGRPEHEHRRGLHQLAANTRRPLRPTTSPPPA